MFTEQALKIVVKATNAVTYFNTREIKAILNNHSRLFSEQTNQFNQSTLYVPNVLDSINANFVFVVDTRETWDKVYALIGQEIDVYPSFADGENDFQTLELESTLSVDRRSFTGFFIPSIDRRTYAGRVSRGYEFQVTFKGTYREALPVGILYEFPFVDHDFSMISVESSLVITAATKISDSTSATGYSAQIDIAGHGYIGNKLVTISGIDSDYNGLKTIKIISANRFTYPIASGASSGPSIGSATALQDSFTLFARVDSRLTISELDGSYHAVSLYLRNYLSPSDIQGGDWTFQNHSTFKNKTQDISVPSDNADQTLATLGWSIDGMTIQSTFDTSVGTTYQLFATKSLTHAEVVTLLSDLGY